MSDDRKSDLRCHELEIDTALTSHFGRAATERHFEDLEASKRPVVPEDIAATSALDAPIIEEAIKICSGVGASASLIDFTA